MDTQTRQLNSKLKNIDAKQSEQIAVLEKRVLTLEMELEVIKKSIAKAAKKTKES